MQATNFKITEELKDKYGLTVCTFGEVDVESGHLWWRKTQTFELFKTTIYWRFKHTGRFTPDCLYIDAHEAAYRAERLLEAKK